MNTPSNVCAGCNGSLVYNSGVIKGKVAFVDSYIDGEDLRTRQIYKGRNLGALVTTEVARAGLPVHQLLYTALWRHPTNDTCLDVMIRNVLGTVEHCSAILLMGTVAVQTFTNNIGSMPDLIGLVVPAPLFGDKLVMVAPMPASVTHSVVGEFRYALTRFGAELRYRGVL